MSHLNKHQKNEIVPFTAVTNETSMYQKEAEMVLLKSQISFQKGQLLDKIDKTLINRDEQKFSELSKQYIQLLNQYSYLN
ncbi:IDEAL domain-containing protein [Litchfieldia salsa]|uniref:IDEAL domain-containing protein n=1 Tax=Litchfieldia salsa TaxID=930152 RepID=A0A1H0RNF2_9BACI|nr:IDEAL domain-containing protein [Litchfieldia salsa]SDP30508.1 IDEAL domain-containing protein [Litchfieldia salsa]